MTEISSLDERVRALATAALAGTLDEADARRKIAWEMFTSGAAQEAADAYLRGTWSKAHLRDDIVRHCEVYIFTAVTGCSGTSPAGTALGLADDSGLFSRMCKNGPRFDLHAPVRGDSAQGWLRHILPSVIRHTIIDHFSTASGYVSPVDPTPAPHGDEPCVSVFDTFACLQVRSAEDDALHESAHLAYSDTALASIEAIVRNESPEFRTLAYGAEVRTHVLGGVPALARPLDSRLRRRLFADVTADPTLAHDALDGVGDPALHDLWSSWSAPQMDRLAQREHAAGLAYALTMEALTDLPLPRTDTRKRVGFQMVGILAPHGVDAALTTALISQFFKDEYTAYSWKDRKSRTDTGPTVMHPSPYHWTMLARTLRVPEDVLPHDLTQMRDAIIRFVDGVAATGRALPAHRVQPVARPVRVARTAAAMARPAARATVAA